MVRITMEDRVSDFDRKAAELAASTPESALRGMQGEEARVTNRCMNIGLVVALLITASAAVILGNMVPDLGMSFILCVLAPPTLFCTFSASGMLALLVEAKMKAYRGLLPSGMAERALKIQRDHALLEEVRSGAPNASSSIFASP